MLRTFRRVWDHPRVCGEKEKPSGGRKTRQGSPPRVRGKEPEDETDPEKQRITPACAGKSKFVAVAGGYNRDHPRVCGEKLQATDEDACEKGSPPRVRGKGRLSAPARRSGRITPACAGKRWRRVSPSPMPQDHPRVCGEKSKNSNVRCKRRGSPPRVRGKGSAHRPHFFQKRITPACAGKRAALRAVRAVRRDHPRVCGEKAGRGLRASGTGGSPPRVRGKVPANFLAALYAGITPACAGKSIDAQQLAVGGRDHPRVCGEKPHFFQKNLYRLGSPPRVRGKVASLVHRVAWCGITPACAGKSGCASASRAAARWDHPRVCGEKRGLRYSGSSLRGSPPRVRGKGSGQRGRRERSGITPACAGKSCKNRTRPE